MSIPITPMVATVEQISFRQHILNGIRVDDQVGRNAPFMVEMQNLRCDRFGAKQFDPLTQPWTDAYLDGLNTKAWPSPQYFQFKTHGILAFADEVYEVNYSANTVSLLTIKNFSNFSSTFTITPDGPWHVIDLYGTWMLFNGTTTLMRWGVDGQVYGTSAVTIKTGCDYRETRAFWAGFNPANCFALADWNSYLDDYLGTAPDGTETSLDGLQGALGRNSVWWSSWYGGDLLWLFSLTYMKFKNLTGSTDSGYSASDPYWIHLKRMQQSGNRVMPWAGDVAHIRELGDGVAVYGQAGEDAMPGGAAGLVPVDGGVAHTFGLRMIAGWPGSLGIAGRSAAGGDPFGHVAVSEEGELWRVEPDFTASRTERAGYREVFSRYIERGNDIVVSLDSSRRDFYIADGEECHVLTPSGLCEAPVAPTTIYMHTGEKIGVLFDDDLEADEALLVFQARTCAEDGKIRVVERLKHIGQNSASTPIQFAIDYRVSEKVDYTRTSFVTADEDGEAAFMIPCIDYRPVLKCSQRINITVDDVIAQIGEGTARLASWPASSSSASTE